MIESLKFNNNNQFKNYSNKCIHIVKVYLKLNETLI